MSASDDELYHSYLSGNNSAYDELMIRYGDNLTCYLKGFLRSIEDAEDLMIESFARIMVKKPKIKEGNFKAYHFRVAHNLVSHLYKKEKRLEVFSLDDFDEDVVSDTESFEELLFDDERKKALHRCLERLEPDLREAVWLVYFENMKYDQAAEIMKVNRKKIDNILSRAKTVLRKEMETEGYTGFN